MKQKTHSGLKKRVKIRKSGTPAVQKSCKNHLLSNKSKRQKKAYMSGMPIDKTKMQALRRLLPGIVRLKIAKKPAGTVKSTAGEAVATKSKEL